MFFIVSEVGKEVISVEVRRRRFVLFFVLIDVFRFKFVIFIFDFGYGFVS